MKKFLAGSSLFLLPVLTFAQITTSGGSGSMTTISQVLNRLQSVINLIIPFIVGLAVLVIIYGIFGFVTSAGDEEARANAKQFIIWGVIGVFLMVSVWGLVTILVNSFSTDQTAAKTAAGAQKMPETTPGTAY